MPPASPACNSSTPRCTWASGWRPAYSAYRPPREQHRRAPAADRHGEQDASAFAAVEAQLAAYFAGTLTRFDVPLALVGSPFQQEVWAALLEVPYGTTVSYRELAVRIGRPAACRAVGLANGRNPVSIIVPCHRVVGADGSLTGYGGGVHRKSQLLAVERRVSHAG